MKRIAIFGAGGVGKEIIMTIEAINAQNKKWEIMGFYEDDQCVKIPGNYSRLGNIDDLVNYQGEINLILALSDNNTKAKIYNRIKNTRIRFINIIHPTALISRSATIGIDNIIGPYTVIGPTTIIGNHSYVGSHSNIGHDTQVDDHCSIMPGCMISGNVILKEASFIGTGAKILQGLTIQKNSIVGAGAVVTKSTLVKETVVGIPAKSKLLNT